LRSVFLKSAPVEQASQAVPVGELLQLRGLLPELVGRCLVFGEGARDEEAGRAKNAF
jgi:hypothetical protein